MKMFSATVRLEGHRQLLIDDADTQILGLMWALRLDRLTVEQNRARIALVYPGDDEHQRALPRSILADHSVNLSGPKGHADIA